jgi:hypothetical protein
MNKVSLGEIVYCNIYGTHNKNQIILREVIYKNNGSGVYNGRELIKHKITEPIKINRIEVIKRLGFENK